jgi:hypothetical protein
LKMIDHLPFQAVSAFFHDTMAAPAPRLPEDPGQLLELALLQHESFRAVNLDDPPVERLKGAAALQFYILAALFDLHARPLFQVGHDRTVSTALLYAEMIRRLLTHTQQDQSFESRSARYYLHPLRTTFNRLTQPFHEELSSVASLPALHQHCADYLNYLAFALYKLQNFPLAA